MATLKQSCHGCGATIDAGVGQHLSHRGLAYWIATRCPHCGDMSEADGGPDTPEEVRRAIIAEEGFWALHVELNEDPKARVSSASALRAELGLSVAETAQLKARLPCEVARGTRMEMEDLRLRLAERRTTGRLVLIEPATVAAREPVKTPRCACCQQWPEQSACARCTARICQFCRADTHCPRCSFELVREVLVGRRVGHNLADAKMLAIALGEADMRFDARRIERRRPSTRSPDRYDVKTAPFVVGELLDRARIARLEAPTVATLHGAPVPRFGALKTFGDLCAWFLPEPDALRVFVRERAELPPAPQAIPAEGPFALPPPVPPYVTPERMYREEPSPRACPHCGKTATRFRDLGDRLVCPSCGASFAAS